MFLKTKWSYTVNISASQLRDILHSKFLGTNTFVVDTDMGKKTRKYFGQNMMDHIELSETGRAFGNARLISNAFIYVKPLNDLETNLDVTFKFSAIWILIFVFLYLGIFTTVILILVSDQTTGAKMLECLKALSAVLLLNVVLVVSHYLSVRNYKLVFKQLLK